MKDKSYFCGTLIMPPLLQPYACVQVGMHGMVAAADDACKVFSVATGSLGPHSVFEKVNSERLCRGQMMGECSTCGLDCCLCTFDFVVCVWRGCAGILKICNHASKVQFPTKLLR